MITSKSLQSPPLNAKKHSSRLLKWIAWVVGALLLLYSILLIPFGDAVFTPAAGDQPPKPVFTWNQDEYWMRLETTYRSLHQAGCVVAVSTLDSKFHNVKKILSQLEQTRFQPEEPVFRQLENLVFEMGPVVSACNTRVTEYIKLIAAIRSAIKVQSIGWDLNSVAGRSTLYRLLYGARAAAEEVILQAPAGVVAPLALGKSESSQTPSAVVENVRVHSGDILVSRGGAATSALIARGNDYPGNFSHIAFVYINPDTHTPYIVEALIEQGVVISTVDKYLKDKKLRIMLLRFRADLPQLKTDPMLPHKAAERAYTKALMDHTPYDFEMNYQDHRKLFCSEVVSAGYEPFGITLWTGISHISSPGLRRWLSAFGVRYFKTQEPSDLEYDPQLSVVAEWRNQATLKEDHADSAVTDVMLEGAERGEKLDYPLYRLPLVRLVKAYSTVLNSMGKVGPIPEGMSSIAALRYVGYTKKHDDIAVALAEKVVSFKNKYGYEPPYWQLVRLGRSAKQVVD